MFIRAGNNFKNRKKISFDSDLQSIFYKKKYAFTSGTVSLSPSGNNVISEFKNSQFFVVILEYFYTENCQLLIKNSSDVILQIYNGFGFINEFIYDGEEVLKFEMTNLTDSIVSAKCDFVLRIVDIENTDIAPLYANGAWYADGIIEVTGYLRS